MQSQAVLKGLLGAGGLAVCFVALAALVVPGLPAAPLVAVGFVGIGACLAAFVIGARQASAAAEQAELAEAAMVRMTEEVRRHRNALDEFASSLDVMIFVTDSRGIVRYANEQARRAFAWNGDPGQPLMAITFSHELDKLIKDVNLSGLPQQAELSFHHPVERFGLVKAWAEPPSLERIFISIFDITPLRRLERVRRDFVANVSHELRTPMSSIRVMAETLHDDPAIDPDTRSRYEATIIKEIDRLAQITEDLLTLSMVESQPIVRQRVDVGGLLKDSLESVRQAGEEKGLEMAFLPSEAAAVDASPGLVSQVFVNLLQNAIAYTNSGRIRAWVERGPDFASAIVEDTGIGIGSEHLPRIFERFYRVDKGRSRARGGTGLGLSIVRHVVEAHGGRVSVTSSLGQGSRFTVELPLAAQPLPAAEPGETSREPLAASELS